MEHPSFLDRLRGWGRRVFFWLPSSEPSEEVQVYHGHDHALLLSVVSKERVPRMRQLRHVFRLLTPFEQRIFLIAGCVGILALATAGFLIASDRVVTVPVVGGTLTEALIGDPKHLNPLDAPTNDVDRDLVRLIYSGLFRYEGTEAVPDLAEQYEWSDDRKTLTVHLRKDARFHDGEALTSADVRFTIESIQDPARKSPLLSSFHDVAISVTDNATVVFQLDQPNAQFLKDLTVGILPSQLWQDIPAVNARLSDLNVKPIGSGPFRVKSFLRDNLGAIHSYTLERFDPYYGVKPFLKTLVFQFFTDRRSALDALKAELVDALAFVGPDDAQGSSNRKHDVKLDLPQETVAFFNLKDKTLSNKSLRQALALAVDRKEIVAAENGSAEAVSGPYPFLTPTSTVTDLEHARQILTESGWTVPKDGGVRIWNPPQAAPKTTTKSKKTTTPVPAPVAVSSTELAITISLPDDPQLAAVADSLKRAWSLLGVRVTVETLTTEDLMRRATRDRDTQVVLLNVLLGPDQDQFPFWWSGQAADRGLNISGLRDRAVDDALDQVRNATTTDALVKAQQAASDAILQSTPALFLVHPIEHYLLSSKLLGVPGRMSAVTPSERFQSIEAWYLKTGWRWK